MDHTKLLIETISEKSLAKAFEFVIYDRVKREYFYNPIEINFAIKNKDLLIDELLFELKQPENYRPRTAVSYFTPKILGSPFIFTFDIGIIFKVP